MNDVTNHMNLLDTDVTTTMYADDITFSFSIDKTVMKETENIVRTVLTHSEKWFGYNELYLNNEKTIHCLFSSQRTSELHYAKFLGVQFDSHMSWSSHIDTMCTSLSKAVYAIRKISFIIDSGAALTAYYGMFHSVLNYGVLAWGNASHSQLQRIFLVQKAAVRGIMRASHDEHCRQFFKSLKIMTVFAVILYQHLIHTKKHLTNYCTLSDIHGYNTHGKNKLIPPSSRINVATSLGVDYYNILPENVSNLPLNAFKRKVRSILLEVAPYNFNQFKEYF
ncbi:unnamed protein product [Callosobruchus maculatus]|uniref:Reverse transcriptase domain-containing protein n=1 Tax=Callosobruchus maculatus TaxID=64391 RepID=A0A653D070_CALMS|nr:unnamed protein product [Callosobruchus maculatus]